MTLLSHEIGFKAKHIIRDKEGHFVAIKGSVRQEGKTITNGQPPNNSFKAHEADFHGARGRRQPITAAGDFNPAVIALIEPSDESIHDTEVWEESQRA